MSAKNGNVITSAITVTSLYELFDLLLFQALREERSLHFQIDLHLFLSSGC